MSRRSSQFSQSRPLAACTVPRAVPAGFHQELDGHPLAALADGGPHGVLPANELLSRLCQDQAVEVDLRPGTTVELLAAALERGHLHVRFPGTRGGTELGVHIDRAACDLGSADFSAGLGTLKLVGSASLNDVQVRCHAEIDLGTFKGTGRIDGVAPLPGAQPDDGCPVGSELLEEQLAHLWRQVLGVDSVGWDSRFFLDLGADSLAAARAAAELKRSFGVNLPVTALLEQDTVRRQAAYLRGAEATWRKRGIDVLKRGAPGTTPLFVVHPIAGVCFPYRSLARRLGETRGVYGLSADQLDTGETMPSIENLASAYIARVKQVQPAGPYLLAGWSFGGVVAFEMAAQLCAGGDEVAHLLLLDSEPPETRLGRGAHAVVGALLRWILRHPVATARLPLLGVRLSRLTPFERFMMGSVLALDPFDARKEDFKALLSLALGSGVDAELLEAWPAGTAAQFDRWYQAMHRAALPEEIERFFLPGVDGPAAARMIRVIAQSMALEMRYRPRRRYPGPMTLFTVRGHRSASRWQRYCERPIVRREYPIQGRGRYPPHFCMLDEENVPLFAADVDAVLESSSALAVTKSSPHREPS